MRSVRAGAGTGAKWFRFPTMCGGTVEPVPHRCEPVRNRNREVVGSESARLATTRPEARLEKDGCLDESEDEGPEHEKINHARRQAISSAVPIGPCGGVLPPPSRNGYNGLSLADVGLARSEARTELLAEAPHHERDEAADHGDDAEHRQRARLGGDAREATAHPAEDGERAADLRGPNPRALSSHLDRARARRAPTLRASLRRVGDLTPAVGTRHERHPSSLHPVRGERP